MDNVLIEVPQNMTTSNHATFFVKFGYTSDMENNTPLNQIRYWILIVGFRPIISENLLNIWIAEGCLYKIFLARIGTDALKELMVDTNYCIIEFLNLFANRNCLT